MLGRSTSLIALVLCLLAPAGPALADAMDLALGRLRIVGGRDGCVPSRSDNQFCPNNELFERLVSEMAVALAPPVNSPAHTVGVRGFRVGLSSTVTTVEADQVYWVLGTEGADANAAMPFNATPASALVLNRVELRKGLPFGFELGSCVGHAASTSLWMMGASLKWALVEGFRSDLGSLPDVALSGTLSRSIGGSQATFHVGSAELTLSKPYVAARSWELTPLIGVQALIVDVESDVIDLTPGGAPAAPGRPPLQDAFESCTPLPGAAPDAPTPTNIACTGDGSDFDNDVVFDRVMHSRVRLFLGGQARYDVLYMSVTVHLDVSAPSLDADDKVTRNLSSDRVARQLAVNLAVGASL